MSLLKMPSTRTFLFLTLCLFLAPLLLVRSANARLFLYMPYDKLTAQADLIVIATPTGVRDTQVKTTLPDIVRSSGNDVPHPISAVGMETTFEVLTVLKGDANIKNLVFYHLRESDPPKEQFSGPGLVAFDPNEKKRFLLFLKRDPDGRYSALTGQADPIHAVKDLGNYP
jgi:hypothetical protein